MAYHNVALENNDWIDKQTDGTLKPRVDDVATLPPSIIITSIRTKVLSNIIPITPVNSVREHTVTLSTWSRQKFFDVERFDLDSNS